VRIPGPSEFRLGPGEVAKATLDVPGTIAADCPGGANCQIVFDLTVNDPDTSDLHPLGAVGVCAPVWGPHPPENHGVGRLVLRQ